MSSFLPFHLEDFFLDSFICTISVFLCWVICRDFFTAVQSSMKYCFNELVCLHTLYRWVPIWNSALEVFI